MNAKFVSAWPEYRPKSASNLGKSLEGEKQLEV